MLKAALVLLLAVTSIALTACADEEEDAAPESSSARAAKTAGERSHTGGDAKAGGRSGGGKPAVTDHRRPGSRAERRGNGADAKAQRGKGSEVKNVPGRAGGRPRQDGPKGKPGSSVPRRGSDKPKTGSARIEKLPPPASAKCLKRAARVRKGDARGRASARCHHISYRAYRRKMARDCRRAGRVSYRTCMEVAFGDR